MSWIVLMTLGCGGRSSGADSAAAEETAGGSQDGDGDGVPASLDCDDANPDAWPGAVELCDGADNDCDGTIDDGYDSDGDGSRLCDSDCNDEDPMTWPGAAPQDSAEACMTDWDGDGFGAMNPAVGATPGTDCNDSSPETYPGAAEREVPAGCMVDLDGDGYGSIYPASGGLPGTDCDDDDSEVHPGAAEVCDSRDNNCDGLADEGSACTHIGHYTPFEQSITVSPGFLFGARIAVPASSVIDAFGVIGTGSSSPVKMALYADSAGAPTARVAAASGSTLGARAVEIDIADVEVAAGTYWLMAVFESPADIGYTTETTETVSYRAQTFTSALPDPFGAAQTYTGQDFNFYLVLAQ